MHVTFVPRYSALHKTYVPGSLALALFCLFTYFSTGPIYHGDFTLLLLGAGALLLGFLGLVFTVKRVEFLDERVRIFRVFHTREVLYQDIVVLKNYSLGSKQGGYFFGQIENKAEYSAIESQLYGSGKVQRSQMSDQQGQMLRRTVGVTVVAGLCGYVGIGVASSAGWLDWVDPALVRVAQLSFVAMVVAVVASLRNQISS